MTVDQLELNAYARDQVEDGGAYHSSETLWKALDRHYPEATDEQIEAAMDYAFREAA